MRKLGTRRPRTVQTVANISAFNDLVLSQKDAHQTHRTTRQIARETGIHRSSAVRIIRDELRLKCVKKRHAQELTEANCFTRLSHMKKLLSKFPESAVDFIFFTDEKAFTVAPPVNLQNNRVYAPRGTRKHDIAADRLLRTRLTSSKSVMVSVAVSKLGCSELIFVDPGVFITEMFCYRTRCFLQSDIWQAMCSNRIARRPIVHVPQLSICARLHLNSYHLTYGRLSALTLTRSIIRFRAVFRNACTRSPYVTWIS